jgi:hypothetical protein
LSGGCCLRDFSAVFVLRGQHAPRRPGPPRRGGPPALPGIECRRGAVWPHATLPRECPWSQRLCVGLPGGCGNGARVVSVAPQAAAEPW